MQKDGKKYKFEKMVKGGQIYNFYMFVNGEMRVDQSISTSPSGRTNWILVPLSEKNIEKAKSIFSKPL